MSTEGADMGFESAFRGYVRSQGHSFGRMAQIIDEEWRRLCQERGEPERGLLVICKACGTLINCQGGAPVDDNKPKRRKRGDR